MIIYNETKTIYEFAQQLIDNGLHLSIMENYMKYPKVKNYYKSQYQPHEGMTGMGIVAGKLIKDGLYVYAIDIDIHRSDRREEVFQRILGLTGPNVYYEKTPSDGYHIVFFSKSLIEKKKTYDFSEEQDCAKHSDGVELFAGGNTHFLVAPSMAKNKSEQVGQYKQVSQISLLNSAVLSQGQVNNLLQGLDELSIEYKGQKFVHKYVTDHDHRNAIRQVYRFFRDQGHVIAPLSGGDRFCHISNWNNIKEDHFNSGSLTGLVLKLGEQGDRTYLNCFDIDDVPEGSLQKIINTFSQLLGKDFYLEESVSGGYHILFTTTKSLDLQTNWYLYDKVKLEVLSTEHQQVNLAPTCAYIKKYEFSGCPEYRQSSVVQGDIKNIRPVRAEEVREFISCLKIRQKTFSKGSSKTKYKSVKEENYRVKQYMWQNYDKPEYIEKQIKAVYSSRQKLLNFLGIEYKDSGKDNYLNFFSISVSDDGQNPDAIIYHNNNDHEKNTWPGYSVLDFHCGEMISFGQYLCKFEREKFDKLMKDIGYGKKAVDVPIKPMTSENIVEIEVDKYPTPNQADNIITLINNLIQENQGTKKTKIILTAPTGSGKTEMFYRLAKQEKIKMIMALAYTSQVQQGKAKHSTKDILSGMCESDHIVPETGSIFMTYDKALKVQKAVNPYDYLMVIDESHNLINQDNFRNQALSRLKDLAENTKAIVYMTATPEDLNYQEIDMIIKIKLKTPQKKSAVVVKYDNGGKNDLSNILLNKHQDGMIDVVYANDKKKLRFMEAVVQQKRPNIEPHVLFADKKETSQAYSNIYKSSKLSGNDIFSNGGILFTTNLIVDGVNILDENIGNIFLLDPQASTDLIQFPARFRNGYQNYFILVSGQSQGATGFIDKRSREDLIAHHYNLALKQQEVFHRQSGTLKRLCKKEGLDYLMHVDDGYNSGETWFVKLVDRFPLLDSKGNILEERILQRVQRIGTLKMRCHFEFLKIFMENDVFGYNFQLREIPIYSIQKNLSDQEINQANQVLNLKIKEKEKLVLDIISGCRGPQEKDELLYVYLKKHNRTFTTLDTEYRVDSQYGERYQEFISIPEVKKMLYRYCTGLELNAENPLEMVTGGFSNTTVQSMKRIYQNLKEECISDNVKRDDKYYRFEGLRRLVRSLKKDLKQQQIELSSTFLKTYIERFNIMKGLIYTGKDVKQVVQDLNDIFEVKKIKQRNSDQKETIYVVGEEWTLDNIYGIKFQKS